MLGKEDSHVLSDDKVVMIKLKLFIPLVAFIFFIGGIFGRITDYGKDIDTLKSNISMHEEKIEDRIKDLQQLNKEKFETLERRIDKNTNRQEDENKKQDEEIQKILIKLY